MGEDLAGERNRSSGALAAKVVSLGGGSSAGFAQTSTTGNLAKGPRNASPGQRRRRRKK